MSHQPKLTPLRPIHTEPGARETLVDRWVQPLVRFLHVEAASGVVLLAATAVALLLANSPAAAAFATIWETRVGLTLGGFQLYKPLLLWINDGLMSLFFFVVGLEIKRELVAGELRDPRNAALPMAGALGGMIVPAVTYLVLQRGQPGQAGWAIPMATDIAFVVGVLALLGSQVPSGLKIFLLSLAIVDDLGSVLIIGLVFTAQLSLVALGLAGVGVGVMLLFNRIGVRHVAVYVFVGAGVWLAVLKSGLHPTIAGVVLGLLTPARAWLGDQVLMEVVKDAAQRLRDRERTGTAPHDPEAIYALATTAHETIAPLERLETTLHPWVAFLIMPLFALANAGVSIDLSGLGNPIAIAVAAGLTLGKPLGIVLVSWGVVQLGLARLPDGVHWKSMLGAGCLGGIGFTMSLFIAGLALDGDVLTAGKIGTLTGSVLSALLGVVLLATFLVLRAHNME